MTDVSSTEPSGSWREAFKVYTHPRVAGMLLLGFSAGLPLLLVLGTLSFWLREAGIDRATIGFLSWIGLAYGFKWAWAPLVDRLRLPLLHRWLGRRRSWLLFAQVGIACALVGVALSDPQQSLSQLVGFALLTAFLSATQDIALDAYRIEAVKERMQGAMAATYQAGYRLAMITASAGALWIAAGIAGGEGYHYEAWRGTYLAMAGLMLVGMAVTLLLPEPESNGLSQGQQDEQAMALHLAHHPWLPPRAARAVAWVYGAAISPLLDFVRRYRWQAVLILALIATYRISDVVMGVMSNPFYVDMGYTKEEVATVSKVFGVIMTIVGAALGGLLTVRFGVMRILFVGALLSAATNVLFAWLAGRGHDVTGLIFVVSADNLSAGIASSAFVAYLSGLTNVAYSATQYALFSSLMLLLPKFIAGFSGVAVNAFGYAAFFNTTALLGLPVLFLVVLAARAHDRAKKTP
jgi:PAT family beta-lactamase induction signal transducer AmpG